MEYPGKLIKRYNRGEDVLAVKSRLVSLGFLHAATHDKFGDDSYRAVKAFQVANNLEADGIVGPLTWAALFPDEDENIEPVSATEIPDHIGATAAKAIGIDLAQVSDVRRQMCLEALKHCIDPNAPYTPLKSFYIRGGNLFSKDLAANVMTKSKLTTYFNKKSYAPYYDSGRKEMMLKHAEQLKYKQTGADCSGGIVGLLRKFKVYDASFDATADTLYKSHCVQTKTPQAGDFAWKSGHIGLYVGGGYVVEWAGGAYGCQLTKLKDRRAYDFVKGKTVKLSAWKAYGDPKKY